MTIIETRSGHATRERDLGSMLEALVADDRWSFRQMSPGDVGERLYQYPAMMVPRLQREILEVCADWDSSIRTVYDPFLGSGTVLTEVMLRGFDFAGGDINPLAILISRVRADVLADAATSRGLRHVLDRAASRRPAKQQQFPGREKWFTPEVARQLDRLRSGVAVLQSPKVRRFMWVALAETVRLVSNSRTSTVKLHVRPAEEIADRPDPVEVFAAVAQRNATVLTRFRLELERQGRLHRGHYAGDVCLTVCDVRDRRKLSADLVVTSPPYGDGHSTVPYGQASYLPLSWIDTNDIGRCSDELLVSTRQIDFRSLGGSLVGWSAQVEAMTARSTVLSDAFDALRDEPDDRTARVASFYSDLDASLAAVLGRVADDGLIVMTVGDRTVGGVKVPMADVIRELLHGEVSTVAALNRTIPLNRKRQAGRNPIASTMASETVLVLQRTGRATGEGSRADAQCRSRSRI